MVEAISWLEQFLAQGKSVSTSWVQTHIRNHTKPVEISSVCYRKLTWPVLTPRPANAQNSIWSFYSVDWRTSVFLSWNKCPIWCKLQTLTNCMVTTLKEWYWYGFFCTVYECGNLHINIFFTITHALDTVDNVNLYVVSLGNVNLFVVFQPVIVLVTISELLNVEVRVSTSFRISRVIRFM